MSPLNVYTAFVLSLSAWANPSCLQVLQKTMESDEALITKAQAFGEEYLAKRGPLVTPEQPGFRGGVVRAETHGVPAYHALYAKRPGEVFRHYISGRIQNGQWHDAEATRKAILRGGRLVAGYTPYVKSDTPPKWYFERFTDLTGIFLTKPDVEAEKVGVFPSPWIDVVLDDRVPVIEIEPGRIYFIPGPPIELVVPFKTI